MLCYFMNLSAKLILAPALIASFSSSAIAAEPKTHETTVNLLDVLAKGGAMMYPLGILSIITILLILMFFLSIRRNMIVSDNFMNAADALIRKGDYLGLIAFSHRRNECMARITQKTMDFVARNTDAPFDSIREIAQTEGSRQASILTSRITYLAEIGAIAPMIGLLGTVIGMIKAFLEIANGDKQGVREMGLAEGVSEALIATAAGLSISILAFIFYSLFRARVQRYISELESAATHLIGLLHSQFDKKSFPEAQPQLRSRSDDFASFKNSNRQDIPGL